MLIILLYWRWSRLVPRVLLRPDIIEEGARHHLFLVHPHVCWRLHDKMGLDWVDGELFDFRHLRGNPALVGIVRFDDLNVHEPWL
jgi:hypothetical protein